MVFSPNGKSWITWGLVIPMKIQELVDLCGWHEQLCLGCLWWWNASPGKQWMLSCSTDPVPSNSSEFEKWPCLPLSEEFIAGCPKCSHYYNTLSEHSWVRYPHPYPRFHSQWGIVDWKMEQEHATTFLIVWAQLPPRQHLLPVVPCEDGDDEFFRSFHETVTVCLTGLTSLLSKNSFSLVWGIESSPHVLRESGVTSKLWRRIKAFP